MNDKEKMLQLEEEIKRLKKIESDFVFFLENTSDFIYFKDLEHKFTFTSNAFARLSNHSNWRELIGKSDFDIFPYEHAILYYEKEKNMMQEGKRIVDLEEPYYNDKGELCWVSSSKVPIVKNGKITGLFGISRDITRIKRLQDELSKKANFDDLSKLLNRASLLNKLSTMIEISKMDGRSLAIFYIDLDNFKNINDTYGHKAGDVVIKVVAKRFTENFKESDVIVGRIGGDEFLIFGFFPCNEEVLVKTANENIVQKITQPIEYSGIKLNIGCSIGISCYPRDGEDMDELISKADIAMYKAKQNDKCKVIYENSNSKSHSTFIFL
jgi:diguanylate cyclase (GGDEF)-like protein/PAS domain S-box-containing protein